MIEARTENFGDVYEQAVVKTVAGFFRGNSTHLFGVTRFGAPGVYVRAGSSHLNEVVWPQSPRTESGRETPRTPYLIPARPVFPYSGVEAWHLAPFTNGRGRKGRAAGPPRPSVAS